MCTRADVDPSTWQHGATSAKLAIANLSIHTLMFKAGINPNLASNVPDQWKYKPSSKPAHQQSNGGGEKLGQNNKRHETDLFQQQNNKGDSKEGERVTTPLSLKCLPTGYVS
jgi:hypothetical protein